jgi:N-acetylglucosaminyldiphosphoundecaprenol N-acetyl-beta-D-mannosaminyltransferase
MSDTVQVFDYPVYSGSLCDMKVSGDKPICINTINAYSYVIAKRDVCFKEALQSSDFLLPDGFPIVIAARLLKRRKINKIAGEDVFFYLLNQINKEKGKVFFLGASENTLSKIKSRLQKEFPLIRVDSFSPPFKKEFASEDSRNMVERINLFKPDVLFVGMTAPKQEKWVNKNKQSIDSKIICSIGAVFDFYAKTVKRPSRFWIFLHMEWFVRLLSEPRRLWKRYLWHSPQFMIDVFKVYFY